MDILFIPGINNTARTFDGIISFLPEGIRGSSQDCPALETVEAVAETLLADAPERFVVCGHSFGGYVALAMLDLAPERLQGIILINSNDWSDSEAVAKIRAEKAKQALDGAYQELADAASAMAYHPDNISRADLMEERAQGLEGYGAERFAAHSLACASRPDRGALLAATDLPKLVVVADQDVVIPTAKQLEMAERVGADSVVIPQGGHMLPAEQPEDVAKAIASWSLASITV